MHYKVRNLENNSISSRVRRNDCSKKKTKNLIINKDASIIMDRTLKSFRGGRVKMKIENLTRAGASEYKRKSSPTMSCKNTKVHSYNPRPYLYYQANDKDFLQLGKDLELQQIILVIRHGDRTPIERELGTAVADNNENKAYWMKKLPNSEFIN